jgi:hypothetical protein
MHSHATWCPMPHVAACAQRGIHIAHVAACPCRGRDIATHHIDHPLPQNLSSGYIACGLFANPPGMSLHGPTSSAILQKAWSSMWRRNLQLTQHEQRKERHCEASVQTIFMCIPQCLFITATTPVKIFVSNCPCDILRLAGNLPSCSNSSDLFRRALISDSVASTKCVHDGCTGGHRICGTASSTKEMGYNESHRCARSSIVQRVCFSVYIATVLSGSRASLC